MAVATKPHELGWEHELAAKTRSKPESLPEISCLRPASFTEHVEAVDGVSGIRKSVSAGA